MPLGSSWNAQNAAYFYEKQHINKITKNWKNSFTGLMSNGQISTTE